MAIVIPGNLPSFDIASITTPEEGLEYITANLARLKEIALRTNFAREDHKQNFYKNLAFMKQYYERVDYLLAQRGE